MPELPADLQYAGWTCLWAESHEARYMDGTQCKLVYVRDLDPQHDDDRFVSVGRDGRVSVTATGDSWEESFQNALENMRFIDSRRAA
jgi:hypothetical protein